MEITDKAIKEITKDIRNYGELAILFNTSESTIRRWLKKKDIRFSTPDCLALIKKKTGLKQSEILK